MNGRGLNKLLRRQLRRLGLDEDSPPPTREAWHALLDRLSQSYDDADRERYTTERAFSISSREMQELYERLKRSSENELAKERDKLAQALGLQHAAFETMTDGVLVVDGDRRVLTFNDAFLRMWRIPNEVAKSGDDEAVLATGLSQVANRDKFIEKVLYLYEHPSERSFDEVLFVDGRVLDRYSAPIDAPDGSVRARLWVFRDVTEQRRAEEAERQALKFLDSIVENIPHMIFVKEADQLRFVRFNRAGEELIGASRDTLIGKSDHDLFPFEQAELFVAKDREVLANGTLLDISEEKLTTLEGERIVHTKKIPIHDDNGAPRFLLGISHDITEAKEIEEALRSSRDEAERANRAKSEFLSNMSHELRTPLNSIVGFARVLAGPAFGDLTEQQRGFLRYILIAGEHMLTLVNDLLDLRRIEEKKHALDISPRDVKELVDAAIGMVRPLMEERHHRLDVEISAGLARVSCDGRAFVQVLVNLLSNAAKYTPPGGRVTLRGIVDHRDVARFEVIDSGIGMSSDDQSHLFTYFTQVGAKHRHHMSGSGVGLALTRSLLERMGGSIDVRSEVGLGSTFGFELPTGTPDRKGRHGDDDSPR